MQLKIVAIAAALGLLAGEAARAQDSKINTNVGAGPNVPLNPAARLVGVSANVVVGVGYNFTKHHSFVGQFMWAGLPPTRDALRPIWLLTDRRDIHGSANLYTVTANYRLQKQGKTFGAYLITGGGMYVRHAKLSREFIVGNETVCAPLWGWWGFRCSSGFVTDDVTLVSNTSTVFGGNGGVGFTIRLNEEGYKFYMEARYHYAPTSRVNTQIIPVTFGFSW